MQLIYARPSPYSRKVRVTALEKGLADRVEEILASPMEDPAVLLDINPLGKVPALRLDDGQCLYDSWVICEYLDSLAPAPRLIPDGTERFAVLRRAALADGVLDAAVTARLELLRPESMRWAPWTDRQRRAIERGLAAMEQDVAALGPALTLAHIEFAVTLEYLDFRLPDLAWRAGHPALAAWLGEFSQRPSMLATAPQPS
ncbi:MAG: glutathione S-transferase N-terminal domain-containing protein [Immundisolibacter sp.]|uniref:glutathione S-transferase family protein n=1 Tax=Immundisolibacter sp. TaxID=1934948 RepID=UPI0019C2EABC|nr:glutathione S-transferase N-terminal domain-containing protein [Immundisolibacter sp.]MBC7161205.1 glutathione S-transferase N-terminal domain-containing protein [Immundisolibacter sp.]